MKRFGWIGAALAVVALLVFAETAIITNASGYDTKKKVVFAKVRIVKNTVITPDMLELREINIDTVHPEAVESIPEVVGKKAKADIIEGEMLLKVRLTDEMRDIIKAEDRSKRLFSAEFKIDQANAWQFSDKQYVDIIYIPNRGETDAEPPAAAGVTDVSPASNGVKLLKNVRIAGLIDEDGKLLGSSENVKIPKYISFEITQEQAVFLAYAKGSGRVELSCIPGE